MKEIVNIAGRVTVGLAVILFMVSCSNSGDDTIFPHVVEEKIRAIDTVKLIQENSEDGDDAAASLEEYYSLGIDARLLMRLDGMAALAENMIIDEAHRVLIQVAVPDEPQSDALGDTDLELCPLTKDWMMLATWYEPHPFGESWEMPGGDFIASNCVSVITEEEMAQSGAVELSPGEAVRFYFDISDWVTYSILPLEQNYGWVLKTDGDITVYGDSSNSYSPRVMWDE